MGYRSGFTLLEIILVLVIFIVLASVLGGKLFNFGYLLARRNVDQVIGFYDKMFSLADMTSSSYLIVLDHQKRELWAFETAHDASSVCNNLDRLICEFRIKTIPAFNLALRAMDLLEEENFNFEKTGLKKVDKVNLSFLEEKNEIFFLYLSPSTVIGDVEFDLKLREGTIQVIVNPVTRLVFSRG